MPDVGETAGHFTLLELIGSGGFASVYRAEDIRLRRTVAVKILRPQLAADAGFRARFDAEARAAGGIRHPHIVTVYEAGTTSDGLPYIVMELLQGKTLSDTLRAKGHLSERDVAAVVAQLATALDYLHERRIVHRDLKPANVIVGAGDWVTLMDFGIARSLDAAALTLTGHAVGTPSYMAPEQIRGRNIGPPADCYALGVLSFELLCGRPPFQGAADAVMRSQVFDAPPALRSLNPQVIPAVEAAVGRMLAKEPEARFPSAGAFAAALTAAVRSRAGSDTARAGAQPRAPSLIELSSNDSLKERGDNGLAEKPSSVSGKRPPTLGAAPRSHRAYYLAGGAVIAVLILALGGAALFRQRPHSHPAVSAPAVAVPPRGQTAAAAQPRAPATPVLAGSTPAQSGTPSVTATPNPLVADTTGLSRTFSSTDHGYSIRYAADWTATADENVGGATFDFFLPEGGTLPAVSILEEQVDAGATLAQYQQRNQSNLATSVDRVDDEGAIAVGSGRGAMVYFTVAHNGQTTDGAQVYVLANGHGYVMTLRAAAGARDAALPRFAGMLQTFKPQ